jgi:hypothetical protein
MAKEPATAQDRIGYGRRYPPQPWTLDETKLLDIAALRPTIPDVEEASIWLGGDSDIFGPGQPLKPGAGEIVSILTADEEEELRPAK